MFSLHKQSHEELGKTEKLRTKVAAIGKNWCGRELSHFEAGKGLSREMALTSSLDSIAGPGGAPAPLSYFKQRKILAP